MKIQLNLQFLILVVLLTFPGSSVLVAETLNSPTGRSSNCILNNGQKLLGNKNYSAVSYSGYRTKTRTVENCPSAEEIKEDMKILAAMGIKLLRTYNTSEFPQASRILESIRELKQTDPNFEMYVMLGTWIRCREAYGPKPDHSREDAEWNKIEVDTAIEFADKYPDIVKIIAVGNEAMVTWQAHYVPASVILKWVQYIKKAQAEGRIPAKILITCSDNWAAWGGAESYRSNDLLSLINEVDFISLHTYAFHDTYYDPEFRWFLPADAGLLVKEQAALAVSRAVNHQIKQYDAVKSYLRSNNIDKEIHIGETGWASLDNSYYGDNGTCAANEYNAGLFYNAVQDWTSKYNLTCFYFEGFDEPWKSGGTEGSEGHFGLFTVDGKAKYALWHLVDEGIFKGLTRGRNPIIKTNNGKEENLFEELKSPALKKHN